MRIRVFLRVVFVLALGVQPIAHLAIAGEVLRHGTATAIYVGPFGKTNWRGDWEPAENLANTMTVLLGSNGSTLEKRSSDEPITYDQHGIYRVPLDAVDTAIHGRLEVVVAADGVAPVRQSSEVMFAKEWDRRFAAKVKGGGADYTADVVAVNNAALNGDPLPVVVIDWAAVGNAVTWDATASLPDVNVAGIGGSTSAAENLETGFTSSNVGDAINHFFNVATPGLTMNDVSEFDPSSDAVANVTTTANVTNTVDGNLVQINGQSTLTNSATLKLKQLDISNSTGDAIRAVGYGYGLYASGYTASVGMAGSTQGFRDSSGNTVTVDELENVVDNFSDFDPATDTVANVTSVGSVSGSVGSISGVSFPSNFGDLAITATSGRVDVGSMLGTAVGANVPGAINYFYDVASPSTTIDDVGTGGGGDATAANQTTIINAIAALNDFDPTTEKVFLGDGAHGGLSSSLTLSSYTNFLANTVPLATATQLNARTLVAADYATAANQSTISTAIGNLNDFDPATDTVANVTSVGSVSGSVGSISGVSFPSNFGDLAITATSGRVDVGSMLGTAVGANVPGAINYFYDVASPSTTIDDVGTGGGGDATAANQTTIINAIAALNDFDPTTEKVFLGDGAHGGLSSSLTLSSYTNFLANTVPLATATQLNARTLVAADYATAANQSTISTAIGNLNDFDPATDTVANVTSVGSVSGSVGSISGVSFPSNFGDLAITATSGRVDVGSMLGTAVGANVPGAINYFYDVASPSTTIDDVGTGGGGDATAANQTTIINAIAALNDFDPTTEKVFLGDGAHGGLSSSLTLSSYTNFLANTVPLATATQLNARTLVAADYATAANQSTISTAIGNLNDFDPATDTVANVTSVGSVSGSVGSISGVSFPSNFGDLAITATSGRVDVGSMLGTAVGANVPGAINYFYDVASPSTTIDDVGTGGGGDATAANQTTIINAIAALNDFDPTTEKVFLGDGAHGGAAATLTLSDYSDFLASGFAEPGDAMDLVSAAITSAKYDGSTAFPLLYADSGVTAIARVGDGTDTLDSLSDQLDGVYTGTPPTAAAIASEVDSTLSGTHGGGLWTGSGSESALMLSTTVSSAVSTTEANLASGSNRDDAYNGAVVLLTDASNSGYPCIRTVIDYVGATRELVIDAAPGDAFDSDLATGDGVKIFVAERVLDQAQAIDGKSLREVVRYVVAAIVGKCYGVATNEETFYGPDGVTKRVRVTLDAAGNRTDVDYDPDD